MATKQKNGKVRLLRLFVLVNKYPEAFGPKKLQSRVYSLRDNDK